MTNRESEMLLCCQILKPVLHNQLSFVLVKTSKEVVKADKISSH